MEIDRRWKVCRYVWSKFGGLFGFARVCWRFEEALVQRRHPGMKRRSGTAHATSGPVWGFGNLVTAYPIGTHATQLIRVESSSARSMWYRYKCLVICRL